MNDQFWQLIDEQLDEAEHARSADEVIQIFASPMHNSPGFFAGSGGDRSLQNALAKAGWRVIWAEASYHWAMVAPDGTSITYVEGDLFPTGRRSRS